MHILCPRCQADTQESDLYCHACGARLKSSRLVIDDNFHPVPGVVGQPDMRVFKTRGARNATTLRRKLLIGGSVVALVSIGIFGGLELFEATGASDADAPENPPVETAAEETLADEAAVHPVDQARDIARLALDLAKDA